MNGLIIAPLTIIVLLIIWAVLILIDEHKQDKQKQIETERKNSIY